MIALQIKLSVVLLVVMRRRHISHILLDLLCQLTQMNRSASIPFFVATANFWMSEMHDLVSISVG